MGDSTKKKSGFARCIKGMSPVRVLSKARDLYVKSMLDCARSVDWSTMGGTIGYAPANFQRSSSMAVTSRGRDDGEDLMELFKAASTKRPEEINAFGACRRRSSYSARIATTDEHKSSDFSGDSELMAPTTVSGSRNTCSGYSARIATTDEHKSSDFSGDSELMAPTTVSGSRNICSGYSARFATIYEDKPSDFGGDLGLRAPMKVSPRCRRYDINKRRLNFCGF